MHRTSGCSRACGHTMSMDISCDVIDSGGIDLYHYDNAQCIGNSLLCHLSPVMQILVTSKLSAVLYIALWGALQDAHWPW